MQLDPFDNPAPVGEESALRVDRKYSGVKDTYYALWSAAEQEQKRDFVDLCSTMQLATYNDLILLLSKVHGINVDTRASLTRALDELVEHKRLLVDKYIPLVIERKLSESDVIIKLALKAIATESSELLNEIAFLKTKRNNLISSDNNADSASFEADYEAMVKYLSAGIIRDQKQ